MSSCTISKHARERLPDGVAPNIQAVDQCGGRIQIGHAAGGVDGDHGVRDARER